MLPHFRFLRSDAGCISYITTRDEEKRKRTTRHKVFLRLSAIAAVALQRVMISISFSLIHFLKLEGTTRDATMKLSSSKFS